MEQTNFEKKPLRKKIPCFGEEWKKTVKEVDESASTPKIPFVPNPYAHLGISTGQSRHYRPKHLDFLNSILEDIKSTTNGLFSTQESQKNELIVRLDEDIDQKSSKYVQTNGIFQYRVLEMDTCLKLIQEVLNIKNYFPNAPLNSDGIILNNFGFSRKMTFFSSLLAPVIRNLYSLPEDTIVQTTQALIVHYKTGLDFVGGNLTFQGNDGKQLEVQHKVGYGILHEGSVAHFAKNLEKGSRFNLVLWFKVNSKLNFIKLPRDIQKLIIAYCDFSTFLQISATNKFFNESCRTNFIWNIYYQEKFQLNEYNKSTYELKVIPEDPNKNYFQAYILSVKSNIAASKTILAQPWEAPQINKHNIQSLPPRLREIAETQSNNVPYGQPGYGPPQPSYGYSTPIYQPNPQPIYPNNPPHRNNPNNTPRGGRGNPVPSSPDPNTQQLLTQLLQQQQQQQIYPGNTPTYPLPNNDNSSFIDYPKLNHNSNNPNILDLDVPIHLRKYIPLPKKVEETPNFSFPGWAVQPQLSYGPYGPPNFDHYPVKKCMPPMPYFDGEIVLENEVGEFFEIPRFSDLVDFSKECNNIHYTKAT